MSGMQVSTPAHGACVWLVIYFLPDACLVMWTQREGSRVGAKGRLTETLVFVLFQSAYKTSLAMCVVTHATFCPILRLQCVLAALPIPPMVHFHVEQAACQAPHAMQHVRQATRAPPRLLARLTAAGVMCLEFAHRLVSGMCQHFDSNCQQS